MSESLDTLKSIKDRALQELASLAPEHEQERAARLQREIMAMDAAISRAINTPIVGRYSRLRTPIDAVVQFLADNGKAESVDTISKAVTDGGFHGGGRESSINVRRSIGVFLNGSGQQRNVLRSVGDLVGLYEWPDEKFGEGHRVVEVTESATSKGEEVR